MEYHLISEEIDDTAEAKADIVNIINEIATKLVTISGPKSRGGLGFPEPKIVESESPESPAIVTIEAGKNILFDKSEPITVSIYGNNDIQIQLTEEFRSKTRLHNYYHLDDYNEVADVLRKIRLAMHEYSRVSFGE